MRIAIVTGASSGMGREFVSAVERTDNPDEIWVIARRAERLEELKNQIKTPVRPLALDLTKKKSFDEIKKLLKAEEPDVCTLVNASGFGVFGKFTEISLEEQERMIDLNSKALMKMTYLVLPYMHEGGKIYQFGSLSSFQPVPYINVYGATKAFVLSFSRALNKELKGRGIRVMAICPGWVRTNFFDIAVRDDTIVYYNKFYEAKEVVERAICDMKRKADVSICGLQVRAQVLLTKLMPHKLVMDIWCKQQKKE